MEYIFLSSMFKPNLRSIYKIRNPKEFWSKYQSLEDWAISESFMDGLDLIQRHEGFNHPTVDLPGDSKVHIYIL